MRQLSQALPETEQLLATARTILAVASNPGVDFTPQGLAIAAGLTLENVLNVLRSPEWHQVIHDEFKAKAGLVLSHGMDRIAHIIHAEGSKDSDRIQAFRAITSAYEIIAKKEDSGGGSAATATFQEMMGKLAEFQRTKKAKITVHEGTK